MNTFEHSLAPPTPWDINFRLGDIAVRVHPYFWLTTLFLGLDTQRTGIDILVYLLAWAGIEFVSILIHELGHVLMGRFFGSRGHILLTGLCGLAVGSSNLPLRSQRIAVLLAGPGAGFLLALVVGVGFWIYNPPLTLHILGFIFHIDLHPGPLVNLPPPLVIFILHNLLWLNIFWGLVNLLPIWPLDGGQICRELCQKYRGREGVRTSLQISILTAGALAVLALVEYIKGKPLVPFISFGQSLFSVIFFAIFAFTSWQLLQFVRRVGPYWDEEEERPRAPWERDADWWKRGGDGWRD